MLNAGDLQQRKRVMNDLAREQRLQIMLTEEELKAIDDWRFDRRMPTRAAGGARAAPPRPGRRRVPLRGSRGEVAELWSDLRPRTESHDN